MIVPNGLAISSSNALIWRSVSCASDQSIAAMFAVYELSSECSFIVGHGVVMQRTPLGVIFANTPLATEPLSASHASVTTKRYALPCFANRPRTIAGHPAPPAASITFVDDAAVRFASDQSSVGTVQLAFVAPFAHTVVLRL